MGQILVRQLDDETLARLKARAKANDRSAEAEARVLLKQSLADQPADLPTLMSLVGSAPSGRTTEEIVAYVRQLRDEWER